MGTWTCFLAIAWVWGSSALASMPLPPNAVELAWDPSASDGVAGYRVYFGTQSRQYSRALDLGQKTTAMLTGLQQGKTYFFAVTCYSLAGLESEFSTEISYTVPIPTQARLNIAPGPGGNMTLTCTGPPGSSFDILVSTDLVNWRVLENALLDLSGFFQYTDSTGSGCSSRYFRLRQTQPVRRPAFIPSMLDF